MKIYVYEEGEKEIKEEAYFRLKQQDNNIILMEVNKSGCVILPGNILKINSNLTISRCPNYTGILDHKRGYVNIL